MPINYNKVSTLNPLIRSLCFGYDGWIVGGGALWLLDLVENPSDFDVLVPFYSWGIACKLVPKGSPTNSHGGIKVECNGIKIDMWAGDIGWFLSQVPAMPAYAVSPKFMTFLTVDKTQTRVRDV